VLLALSSFLTLVDNDTWIQGFIPKPEHLDAKPRVDITDPGALNITANIAGEKDKGNFGTPIDISAMNGDIGEINAYLVSIFRPGVVVSVDCPECGPTTWYLGVFAAAAAGDQAAQAEIIDAADELTNGRFSHYFKADANGNRPLMFTNICRVPLGSYRDKDQVLDIRNIDYTACANLFANNPSVIHDYSLTFVDRPGVPTQVNLSQREGIIQHALSQKAEIDAYAARPTFSQAFVESLSHAMSDLNLPVQVNTPLNAEQLRSGVSAPDYVNGSLSANTRTFHSNYGGGAASRGYRYGPGSYRR
jgi:hypothetical protein